MAKVKFLLKEPQLNKSTPTDPKTGKANRVPVKNQKETLLLMYFRYKNQRVRISTGETILPEYWEEKEQQAKAIKKFPEHSEFNTRLADLKTRAMNVFRKFQNDNKRIPTEQELKQLLEVEFNRVAPTSGDLFTFIERFIEESKTKVNDKTGKIFSEATIGIYRNTLELLKDYKKQKRKKVDFDTISLDFYHEFKDYLSTERTVHRTKGERTVTIKKEPMATNTIGKYIKTLKTFLNEASERGLNANNAHKSKRFKVMTEETDSIYLNEAELKAMYELDLSGNPKLERVRDLFTVGCWTGLRFSDFSNIKPEHIKGDFITIETQKTAETVVIPIHSNVKAIMAKYRDQYENSLPPAISNVKMNEYLKDLGALVPALKKKVQTEITKGGVTITNTVPKYKLLTTHTARRSFATNLYLDGVPTLTIMKITGHRTEKAFLRYIKVTPDESAKILQLHWQGKNKLKVV